MNCHRLEETAAGSAGEIPGTNGTLGREASESRFGHFSASISPTTGADVVSVHGELDIAGAGVLRDCLAHLTGRDVVVDARWLTFIDAAGLSALALAHRRAARCGRSLSVRGAGTHVRAVFELGGLGQLLEERSPDQHPHSRLVP